MAKVLKGGGQPVVDGVGRTLGQLGRFPGRMAFNHDKSNRLFLPPGKVADDRIDPRGEMPNIAEGIEVARGVDTGRLVACVVQAAVRPS